MTVLTSRRLWTFIVAQVVSIATLVTGHYIVDPFAAQLAGVVIASVEGLAGVLIVAYTVDDVKGNTATSQASIHIAAINAGCHPDFPPQPDPAITARLDNIKPS